MKKKKKKDWVKPGIKEITIAKHVFMVDCEKEEAFVCGEDPPRTFS